MDSSTSSRAINVGDAVLLRATGVIGRVDAIRKVAEPGFGGSMTLLHLVGPGGTAIGYVDADACSVVEGAPVGDEATASGSPARKAHEVAGQILARGTRGGATASISETIGLCRAVLAAALIFRLIVMVDRTPAYGSGEPTDGDAAPEPMGLDHFPTPRALAFAALEGKDIEDEYRLPFQEPA